MGKCETATTSVGIKILLSDLIVQINETNFTLIKNMLYDGFIEDENDSFNEVYSDIICSDELPIHFIDFKEQIMHNFKNNGSYNKSRNGNVIPTIENGCLFNKHLLVPVKKIVTTERWGHNRCGTNGTSRVMDFDLFVNIERYKEIEKIEIVFILQQHSG